MAHIIWLKDYLKKNGLWQLGCVRNVCLPPFVAFSWKKKRTFDLTCNPGSTWAKCAELTMSSPATIFLSLSTCMVKHQPRGVTAHHRNLALLGNGIDHLDLAKYTVHSKYTFVLHYSAWPFWILTFLVPFHTRKLRWHKSWNLEEDFSYERANPTQILNPSQSSYR